MRVNIRYHLCRLHQALFPSDVPGGCERFLAPKSVQLISNGESPMSEVTQPVVPNTSVTPAAPTTVTVDPTAIAVNTIKALFPTLISAVAVASAAGTASNPYASILAALAPVIISAATQMQQAGNLTPAELASMYATIADGINQTQAAWDSMK